MKIQNRLEILRGNKILVPGCEPTSAFTSATLAENRECKAAVVDLADAMKAIPNATIISIDNPKTRFFVLPEGPPPSLNDCNCKTIDYYQILRDIGEEIMLDTNNVCGDKYYSSGRICSAIDVNVNNIKGIFK